MTKQRLSMKLLRQMFYEFAVEKGNILPQAVSEYLDFVEKSLKEKNSK